MRHPWIGGTFGLVAVLWGTHEFLNWQAERRWQRYAEEARARGVKLQLTEFATPEIPDAENFAALPMMRAAFSNGTKPFELKFGGTMPDRGNALKGTRIDWQAWQKYLLDAGLIKDETDDAPRDVLRALDSRQPELAQWREWRTRPRSRFPLDLQAGPAMPFHHFSALQGAAIFFTMRMRANLALGDSAAAGEDFRDGLQAYRAIVDDPTLISGLVRISVLTIVAAGVGEGLRDRAWADVDLQKLESELATIRIWDDYRLALASERGFGNSIDETLLKSPRAQRVAFFAPLMPGTLPSAFSTVFALTPRRLIRDNQLRHNQYFDELLARAGDGGGAAIETGPTPSAPEHITDPVGRMYYFLFRMSAPVSGGITGNYASSAVRIDQTRIACALERHRLLHGAYPETLDALTPYFLPSLPLDPWSGAPYHYRRTEAGSFLLYSVGKNRVDDDGHLDPKKNEQQQPDAVWLYAPLPRNSD